MRGIPVFALAVAAAIVVAAIAAAYIQMSSRPVAALAPYFAVRPGPSGLVNVSVADFYAAPKGAHWYVGGQYEGFKKWVLAPCGSNVTAVVLYDGAAKSISGVIACVPPFKLPTVEKYDYFQLLDRASKAADALFKGAIQVDAQINVPDPCDRTHISVTVTIYPAGGIWPLNGTYYTTSWGVTCTCPYSAFWCADATWTCRDNRKIGAILYYLMPWDQGGDVVPFEINNIVVNGWNGLTTYNGLAVAYVTVNITNLITGQIYMLTVKPTASFVCQQYVEKYNETHRTPIYPQCKEEKGYQGVFAGSDQQYGVVKLCKTDNNQTYWDSLPGKTQEFNASNPTIVVKERPDGSAEITLPNGQTVVAQKWGPIGFKDVVETVTRWFTVANVFSNGKTLYYSLYPFQAPVLAFTDHNPASGPKYVPTANKTTAGK